METNTNAVVILNNTGVDTSTFDAEIVAACNAGGKLPEELADLFVLSRLDDGVNDLATETGRACWVLTMVDD